MLVLIDVVHMGCFVYSLDVVHMGHSMHSLNVVGILVNWFTCGLPRTLSQ